MVCRQASRAPVCIAQGGATHHYDEGEEEDGGAVRLLHQVAVDVLRVRQGVQGKGNDMGTGTPR